VDHDVLADRLGEIESRLHGLREESRRLEDERTGLLAQLTQSLGGQDQRVLLGRAWRIKASSVRVIHLPTATVDPTAAKSLRSILVASGEWDQYSTVNYPRLKSDWLNAVINPKTRQLLSHLVTEEMSVRVRAERL